jgi:hypothetical protein
VGIVVQGSEDEKAVELEDVVIWDLGVELYFELLLLVTSDDEVERLGSISALLSFVSRFLTLC